MAKYTVSIESPTGTRMYDVESYSWLDMESSAYFHMVLADGSDNFVNDFSIRSVHVVENRQPK